jgi:uncharacterized Tic20 family protein
MNDRRINWRALASRHPSAFLLAAQFLSLVLYAVLEGNPNARAVLGMFGVLILTLVIWVLRRSATTWWVTQGLAALSFILSLASVLVISPTLLSWASTMEAVLYFYTAGSLISYMMEDTRVTSDELFAAGATFTLIAWGFAYAFLACETWLPGSFRGVDITTPGKFFELLYASFNNLSSTGSGDIVAVSAPARVLVMIEQFTGVAYVAVVVSRLIGMTITRHRDKDKPPQL